MTDCGYDTSLNGRCLLELSKLEMNVFRWVIKGVRAHTQTHTHKYTRTHVHTKAV